LKIEYIYKAEMRSMEEGTLNYELRKLAEVTKENADLTGVYNPETNEFIRE